MRDALGVIAARFGAVITALDVDADPALEQAFGARAPVLFLGPVAGDIELCHYHLDQARVTAALAAATVSPEASGAAGEAATQSCRSSTARL